MIDVPTRLRRAIAANDLGLVKRILKNNPAYLTNPDFKDKSNTSLHLAAQYGFLEICEHLIALGHDSTDLNNKTIDFYLDSASLGVSHNTDGRTPLHLACANSHTAVVKLLGAKFPECINRADASGMTPLMLAARGHPDPDYIPPPQALQNANREHGTPVQAVGGAAGLITTRIGPAALAFSSSKSSSHYNVNQSTLSQIPSSNAATMEHLFRLPTFTSSSPTLFELISAQDHSGNTALHHASASGNLKALRALVVAGADPLAKNCSGWTPESYSVSVQAEVYFKSLINEWKERTAEGQQRRATEADIRWRTKDVGGDLTRRPGYTSPGKDRQGSEPLIQSSRARRRDGNQGLPSSKQYGSSPASTVNFSGMGKGGLRLVMPEDDEESEPPEGDRVRNHNPYPTLHRNSANNRRRGMTDASHSSSATSGSGSTDLSSGSSRQQDDGGEDSDPLSDELSDESDDETETVRNSFYQLDEEATPVIHSSPGQVGRLSERSYGLTDGTGGRALPQFRTVSRGVRFDGSAAETPPGVSASQQSDINVVTLGSNDVWK